MAVSALFADQGDTIDLSHNDLSDLSADTINNLNPNVERNCIHVFPPVLLELGHLEILDLSRNKIEYLPDDIAKMSSLKVLAVQKNKIQHLPFCISEMTTLLALKIDGNPLTPTLSRIVEAQCLGAAPNSARDNENNDMVVTAQIKQVLKHEARSTASRSVSQTALGSNQQFEPRQHSSKRSRAGRFPVKVDGADLPTSRPSLLSPKSHSKAPSMHSKALWSPSTSYQKQIEGEHSSNNPGGLQTPARTRSPSDNLAFAIGYLGLRFLDIEPLAGKHLCITRVVSKVGLL
ncbi:hypothetical protein FANTH_9174 [Fusarium anthophilum]|uniref:Uncharacterized protein n=1 Tax=Fusarium anthophilum TaxID=48485 RepID=A0A8H4Z7I2_9HYPO|nr:hypothetical protein FANTH_9174 [Fusarium anthophilum]